MRFFALLAAAGLLAMSACVITTKDSGGDGGEGGTGDGGSGTGNVGNSTGDGGGMEIAEGPPGSVGNDCDAGTCDDGLICGTSNVCQPEATALPPEVVQAVPPGDSADIPSSAPIMLFFNGTFGDLEFFVDAYTLDGTTDITGDLVGTQLTTAAGNDVYVLAAKQAFPLGASVVVSFQGALTGSLVFNVDHDAPASADGALGLEGSAGPKNQCPAPKQDSFDGLPAGWKGFGDVGQAGTVGSIAPAEGVQEVLMSTGSLICGDALGGTSSMLVSGAVSVGDNNTVRFDYNFQSSEFDDYCDSEFDDTLLAVKAGPEGAVAEIVTSVNTICAGAEHSDGTFPGAPDGGDTVYKQTGIQTYNLAGDVGSPARLAFVVTDVGDSALSTVVALDNVRLEP